MDNYIDYIEMLWNAWKLKIHLSAKERPDRLWEISGPPDTWMDHSLNGSSDNVNGDLSIPMGISKQISTPQKINAPESIDLKIRHNWLRWWGDLL